MKFIYKDEKYPCVLKSEMKDDMWYSMEPVKITVTIPLTNYFKMRTDIKDSDNNLHFRLLVDKNDSVKNFSEEFNQGLWMVDSQFERSTITSSFSKGVVKVIFKLHIYERELTPKSELREFIMNDLFKK
jgi:sRNA-binding regulator protein Hfq